MTTLGYLLILLSFFVVRGITKSRTITDLPDDLGDALAALVRNDPAELRAVLAREGAVPDLAGKLDGKTGTPTGVATGLVAPITAPKGSPFGMRNGKMHQGQDFPAPTGTPVRAAHAGVIVPGYTESSAGNNVAVAGAGVLTRYLHLSRIDVTIGQPVSPGDVIGLVGNTGRSYGSHLHFEVRTPGAVDPVAYYAERGVVL